MKIQILLLSILIFLFSCAHAETVILKCPESPRELTGYWDYQYDIKPTYNYPDNSFEVMAQKIVSGNTATIRMICTIGPSRMTVEETISTDFDCNIRDQLLTEVMTHCPPGTPPKDCIVVCTRPTSLSALQIRRPAACPRDPGDKDFDLWIPRTSRGTTKL